MCLEKTLSLSLSLSPQMGHNQLLTLTNPPWKLMPKPSYSFQATTQNLLTTNVSKFPYYSHQYVMKKNMGSPLFLHHHHHHHLRHICKMSKSDMTSQLELGKTEDRRKVDKRVNGVFWIILLNLGIYVADHLLQAKGMKILYLYHNRPAWYQFVTATFCHANWNHLSSNLFFLYIFGKLVEEDEGNFALWFSYIVTGAGANLVSWLVLPRNAVSVGASGAVFGLFAISVLVKMSWDWRKILEVLILGQFVIEKVMGAAQASAGMTGAFRGSQALQNVNHIAHLSGALIGVVLVWLLARLSSSLSSDQEVST